MLQHISLQTVLCLDIETVPQYPYYSHLPEETQKQWLRKSEFLKRKEEEQNATLYERAGIYAEFGKIICISAGYLSVKNGERKFHLQSFFGDDEREILVSFISFLKEFNDDIILCAHNGKEFDFPYLCRRMLIQGLKIPTPLQISGKKPWEVNHLDTMELWKFGDYKHYTPLNLLASVFNIANPKDDIDGSQVGEVYWKKHDLARIEKYCIKDVVSVMQILLSMKGEDLFKRFPEWFFPGWGAVLMDKEKLLKTNIFNSKAQSLDYEANLKLMLQGNVAFIKEPSYVWRLHSSQASGTMNMEALVNNLEFIDDLSKSFFLIVWHVLEISKNFF